jgi:hypothetical protein
MVNMVCYLKFERVMIQPPDKRTETPLVSTLQSIQKSFALDQERATSLYSPEMIALVKAARTAKIVNKTRQRQRELRGEVTKRARKRLQKRPPPHRLEKMTEEEKLEDRVMREVSWGGYSGRIKAQAKEKHRMTGARKQDVGALPRLEEASIKGPAVGESE